VGEEEVTSKGKEMKRRGLVEGRGDRTSLFIPFPKKEKGEGHLENKIFVSTPLIGEGDKKGIPRRGWQKRGEGRGELRGGDRVLVREEKKGDEHKIEQGVSFRGKGKRFSVGGMGKGGLMGRGERMAFQNKKRSETDNHGVWSWCIFHNGELYIVDPR